MWSLSAFFSVLPNLLIGISSICTENFTVFLSFTVYLSFECRKKVSAQLPISNLCLLTRKYIISPWYSDFCKGHALSFSHFLERWLLLCRKSTLFRMCQVILLTPDNVPRVGALSLLPLTPSPGEHKQCFHPTRAPLFLPQPFSSIIKLLSLGF